MCYVLCTLEAVESGLYLLGTLEVLDVLEVPELTRSVLLCTLEDVESGLYLLEVLEVLEVPEVM